MSPLPCASYRFDTGNFVISVSVSNASSNSTLTPFTTFSLLSYLPFPSFCPSVVTTPSSNTFPERILSCPNLNIKYGAFASIVVSVVICVCLSLVFIL